MFGVHFLHLQYPEAAPSTLGSKCLQGLNTISSGPQPESTSQPFTCLQPLLALKRVPLSPWPCLDGLLPQWNAWRHSGLHYPQVSHVPLFAGPHRFSPLKSLPLSYPYSHHQHLYLSLMTGFPVPFPPCL